MLQLIGQSARGIARWFVVGKAEEISKELECGGPAGVLCLEVLSQLVNRKLRVYSENEVVGDYGNGEVLEIQYHKGVGCVGHWTGPFGDVETSNNNCLFQAVGMVIGTTASELRKSVMHVLHRGGWLCAEVNSETPCLLGGARYVGGTPEDAREVIDRSHGTVGYGHVRKAHPRGHASHPNAPGPEDSVENYSSTGPKSGWLSRRDQDVSVNCILQLQVAQDAMNALNRGSTREGFTVSPPPEPIKMGEWKDGRMFDGPLEAKAVTMVLQHHSGQQNNLDAEVQVFTCFPRK